MRSISVKVIKLAAAFIFVCSLSCMRGNLHITSASASTVSGIHIAGSDGTDAVYWRNGERFVLSKSGKYAYADAYAMAIAGSDVYIVGEDTRETRDGNLRDDAVYWRNEERFVLPKRGEEACTWGIAVNGSDVYIVGEEIPKTFGGRSNAVYWLNGRCFILPQKGKQASARSIAINGSDVYITGTDGDIERAPVFWLNGKRFELPVERKSFLIIFANAIAISGSDVYITGYEFNVGSVDKEENAMYWHNGELSVLPKLGRKASTSAIAIAGSDVYITGRDLYSRSKEGAISDAVYWLNGERFALPKRGRRARAYAIAVVGPDVYIAGFDEDGPVYWRNGELVPIEGVTLPQAIAVTP
jgi:uncharacterized membrane protein